MDSTRNFPSSLFLWGGASDVLILTLLRAMTKVLDWGKVLPTRTGLRLGSKCCGTLEGIFFQCEYVITECETKVGNIVEKLFKSPRHFPNWVRQVITHSPLLKEKYYLGEEGIKYSNCGYIKYSNWVIAIFQIRDAEFQGACAYHMTSIQLNNSPRENDG